MQPTNSDSPSSDQPVEIFVESDMCSVIVRDAIRVLTIDHDALRVEFENKSRVVLAPSKLGEMLETHRACHELQLVINRPKNLTTLSWAFFFQTCSMLVLSGMLTNEVVRTVLKATSKLQHLTMRPAEGSVIHVDSFFNSVPTSVTDLIVDVRLFTLGDLHSTLLSLSSANNQLVKYDMVQVHCSEIYSNSQTMMNNIWNACRCFYGHRPYFLILLDTHVADASFILRETKIAFTSETTFLDNKRYLVHELHDEPYGVHVGVGFRM